MFHSGCGVSVNSRVLCLVPKSQGHSGINQILHVLGV